MVFYRNDTRFPTNFPVFIWICSFILGAFVAIYKVCLTITSPNIKLLLPVTNYNATTLDERKMQRRSRFSRRSLGQRIFMDSDVQNFFDNNSFIKALFNLKLYSLNR